MIAATAQPCPACGWNNPPDRIRCDDCGCTLRAARPEPVVVHAHGPHYEPVAATLKLLAIGGLVAPVFALTPLLRYMGWFLGSLCHETGHVVMAWLAGCPAFPAIRLDGHAVAIHSDRVFFLNLCVWAGLGSLAWIYRGRRRLLWGFGAATVFYPVFAFTGVRELFFLAGGHLGELAFATVFLWRAIVGWSRGTGERVLYAVCGWFLWGRNVWLAAGLILSSDVRHWYENNGSLGLRNDYLHLAVPPLAWLLARRRRRELYL